MDAVNTVVTGSLLLAIPVAFAAGFLSFLSPCVLPLVPGYLSLITGLTGAELAGRAEDGRDREGLPVGSASTAGGGAAVAIAVRPLSARTRGRVLAGSVLFVLGFSVVFVSYGLLFGALGGWLLTYQALLSRVLGFVVIAMGLAFLGLIPGMQREWRVHRSLEVGLWSAPLLGVLFGLGWSPCLGPTIGAVQTLALTEASAARGALLSFAYCLGLGLPFIAVGLAFRRGLGAIGWVKRHYVWVMRLGGGMLVLIGVLLVTGVWEHLMLVLRSWVAGYGVSL